MDLIFGDISAANEYKPNSTSIFEFNHKATIKQFSNKRKVFNYLQLLTPPPVHDNGILKYTINQPRLSQTKIVNALLKKMLPDGWLSCDRSVKMLRAHNYTVSQKNCVKLFLPELRQISTNFDNFWQKDGKAKIMRGALIFHLT